ncbi:MAG: 23S rRNA (pseudouridine(1915)-N(3))-methyltransferase RlmH [Clostridia bacterium]
MYKINIIAVGNIKEKYFISAIDEYKKRLNGFCKFSIIEIEERTPNGSADTALKQALVLEGKDIFSKMQNAYNIALDIDGEMVNSEQFKDAIITAADKGEVNFIIGSSYGLSNEIKQKSDMRVSFGKMTLPHRLMRVVLVEQIYRAFMLHNNRSYHK